MGKRLVAFVTIEISAVAALHRLGRLPALAVDWHRLFGWLTTSSAEDVLAATLRLVALACAYWLLLSTTLYVMARLADLPAAIRAVEWATLPALRRLADSTLAVALASSTATGGLGVAGAGVAVPFEVPLVVLGEEEAMPSPGAQLPPTVEVPCLPPFDGPSGPALPEAEVPLPEIAFPPGQVHSTAPGFLIPPNPQVSPEPPDGSGGERSVIGEASKDPAEPKDRLTEEFHEVVKGDNLWRIAASTLRRRHGREEITDREIATYWRAVIGANRHRLRSGSPNLVFPGERLTLPD